MIFAHKTLILTNKKQDQYFWQACGIARKAYNDSLAHQKRSYELWESGELKEKPKISDLRPRWTKLKNLLMPWAFDVCSFAGSDAINDLVAAYQKFFKKEAKHPRFKKRKFEEGSFAMRKNFSRPFPIKGKKIKLPRIGWVKLAEFPRFNGTCTQVTVSRRAGRWWISMLFHTESHPNPPCENQAGVVGVDVGIKHLATTSDGEFFENPRAYMSAQKRLRLYNKSLVRKKRGSKNWIKALIRLQKAYKRIADIRKNSIEQLTTHLTKRYKTIVIENLNVSGMVKNRHLSKHVLDAGFYLFKERLQKKAEYRECEIIIADRFFPSSKKCSNCGHKKENLSLSDREFKCESCGFEIDRDLNAAINLKNLAEISTVSACGDESSDLPNVNFACETFAVNQESIEKNHE